MTNINKRLFLGISLNEQLSEALVLSLKEIPEDARIKKTIPSNLHTTLLFLGNVELSYINRIQQLTESVINDTEPFILRPQELVFISSAKKNKMIWLRYEKSDPFSRLNEMLREKLQNLYTHEGIKDPIPHTTLARIKNSIIPVLPENKRFPILPVNIIHLYESVSHIKGPEYKILRSFEMKQSI
jgi:RNA 2',3'-cyclic 3'-phosphodiesterase